MNPWIILGIEQTSELEIIKNAYAEKSKLHHPEEQPEEFQKIHQAYREAVKLAKTLTKEQKKPQQKRIKPPIPQFKRSFYIHKPYDNPARAKFYKSEFDEYTDGQLERFKRENWRFPKSFEYKPKAETITSIGKIPIKGAKKRSSKLNFTQVEKSDLNISTDEFIL